MKLYHLEKPLSVLCIPVANFPAGIQEAFDQLIQAFPATEGRDYYGIAGKDEQGKFVYKAAVKQMKEAEAAKDGYETFIIPAGDYLTETITNWRQQLPAIGETFAALMKDNRNLASFPCIEWYKSETEMLCMVKLDETKNG